MNNVIYISECVQQEIFILKACSTEIYALDNFNSKLCKHHRSFFSCLFMLIYTSPFYGRTVASNLSCVYLKTWNKIKSSRFNLTPYFIFITMISQVGLFLTMFFLSLYFGDMSDIPNWVIDRQDVCLYIFLTIFFFRSDCVFFSFNELIEAYIKIKKKYAEKVASVINFKVSQRCLP